MQTSTPPTDEPEMRGSIAPPGLSAEHPETTVTPPAPAPGPKRPALAERLRRALRPLAVAALLLPLPAMAYYAHSAAENRSAAENWRDRALAGDRMLDSSTKALNTRSAALNRTIAQLSRSEADVRTLEQRQRRLANEKARAEDARAAAARQASTLADIAAEQRECNDGLAALLSAVTYEDYDWVLANGDRVTDACADAQAGFDAFQALYG